jgi:hypothetical protein
LPAYTGFTKFYGSNRELSGYIISHATTVDPVMNCNPTQRPNRVTAVFQNARLSFEIAGDATLAQLAEQLCMLGERHGGPPLSINVRIAVQKPH